MMKSSVFNILIAAGVLANQAYLTTANAPSTDDDIAALNGGGGTWFVHGGRIISWQPVNHHGNDMMKFTVIGEATGYVSMAISVDEDMSLDDCYICSRESPTSANVNAQSAYLTNRTAPTIVGPIDSGDVEFIDITDGMMTCIFFRALSVTKDVAGTPQTWNLTSDPFNLLYAQGEVTGSGDLVYHSYRNHTRGAFSLTDNALYARTINPTPNPEDTINALSGGGGEWVVGAVSVKWEPVMANNAAMMRFTMVGAATGYISMAISVDEDMTDDDCYICARQTPVSSTLDQQSAYLTVQVAPTIVGPVQAAISSGITNDVMTCVFDRPLSVTKSVAGRSTTWNLTRDSFNLLYAEGAVLNDGSLVQHTLRKHTHGRFSLVDNSLYRQTATTMAPSTTSTAQPSTTSKAQRSFATLHLVVFSLILGVLVAAK